MGWFSTLIKVVHTASGLYLQNFGDNLSANDSGGTSQVTTQIGALSFIKNVQTGEATVTNNENKSYYIYFSRLGNDNTLECNHLIIEPKQTLDVDQQMKEFADGHINYTPVELSSSSDDSTVSFYAEYILTNNTKFSDTEHIGYTYELTMSQDKSEMIFTASEEFQNFEILFMDRNGIIFNLRDPKIDKIRDQIYEARVSMPSGCDINYPFRDVKILMTISGEHLEGFKKVLKKGVKEVA
jgi:hypothetical protein